MMPVVFGRGPEEPSAGEPAAQGVRVDEVRECLLPVDLDHRDPLAVARLQLAVATDVDEPDLVAADLPHHLERTLAEVAAGGVEEGDPPRATDRGHA